MKEKKCPKCNGINIKRFIEAKTNENEDLHLYNNKIVLLCQNCRTWFYENEEVKF